MSNIRDKLRQLWELAGSGDYAEKPDLSIDALAKCVQHALRAGWVAT